jgi:hypothetical protein
MFLSELIDLRIKERPTDAPHFSFRLNLPYCNPLLKANLDGRRHSVTTLLQKPLAGAASIVQNAPARSQITIRDASVKRAEIGHIRRLYVRVDQVRVIDDRLRTGEKKQFSGRPESRGLAVQFLPMKVVRAHDLLARLPHANIRRLGPDRNRQLRFAAFRCTAVSQFWITMISDLSDDVTTGTMNRRPSADTSKPTEECNAARASVLILNRGAGSAIFSLGYSVIATAYNRPSEAR